MAGVTLGARPEELTVLVPRTGRFAATLVNDEGPWPTGSAIELRFGGDTASIVWPAAISGVDAVWQRTEAECAAVLALPKRSAVLVYEVGGVEVQWAAGRVHGV